MGEIALKQLQFLAFLILKFQFNVFESNRPAIATFQFFDFSTRRLQQICSILEYE